MADSEVEWDYYITVESSEYEAESVCSLQDKETDCAKDTTDTSDSDSHEIEIEYELATTDEENNLFNDSSSEAEDILATAGAVAAAIYETSLEAWATDWEDSDNSSSESECELMGFQKCIQCQNKNDNPQYRYCDKCFQKCRQCNERKNYDCFALCNACYKLKKKSLPPRPRANRRAQKRKRGETDSNEADSTGLSQDSGIGSEDIKKPKLSNSETEKNDEGLKNESKELCIICNIKPKNGIFLHNKIAHMCCCYECSVKTWKTIKRCPVCNLKISKVIKVFVC